MRALLQRVRSASVEVAGRTVGSIDSPGLLVFLGVGKEDRSDDARWLAEKTVGLRIFPEGELSMQRSLEDIDGSILLVSQFTLYADCRKGRRPSFESAAAPQEAESLYRDFAARLTELGRQPQQGIFGAEMTVRIENYGPVTIWLESPQG